ncbi:hypothetical protein [Variovorax sp. dw_954]|uniref:hypothetical protein n=1 Tax=Variovorax sp. dw_954 TaxID=2720078 RepID=UPI001BD39DAA|nr:hypothetical protein [Variovorax sp. dw_954]
MAKSVLQELIDDATLVGEVASRLGVLDATSDLLPALAAAEALPLDGSEVAVVKQRLRQALNATIRVIAPITLDDLRRGWRPYETARSRRLSIFAFFVFSVVLMAFSAYATQVYERARAMYATTVELQDARGAEQAMRLFGMLKRNQQDVVESLSTGKKEFLYEVFGKALFDLKAMYLKNQSYAPIAAATLNDLEMLSSPSVAIERLRNPSNPTNDPLVREALSKGNYGPSPPLALREELEKSNGGAMSKPSAPNGARSNLAPDVQALLDSYLSQLRRFNLSINVYIDPLQPQDYFSMLFRLRNGISFVGLWVLPALYGMLGAVIFHMRRILNPSMPDPSWMRITFRVVLGAFAGIIVVWFWTPSSQKVSQGEFVALTSFALAFLVGFSTDVFFRALDLLVDHLSQSMSKQSAQ